MNVSHKLEKHICRRKLRQSYNSFPSNFKGSSSFGSFILLTLLEFILVGREQADGGQGISRFVTEDVIVLDVTKLRNVFTGINPIISPAFGLQFESLFFVQVLHGDLVRVLLLGLVVSVLPNNDLRTDLEVSRTDDETVPGLDKLRAPSGRWDDALELFRLQIDRLVQVVSLEEDTETSLRTGTEIQQDLIVSSGGRPERVASVNEEGEEDEA
mmetsp:Transcript_21618/g.51079  ORF Transcript_21618/g.51079 Transcript_21618/m.51079 type:complete len:213 (-) Transcript_21618:111-749(-)